MTWKRILIAFAVIIILAAAFISRPAQAGLKTATVLLELLTEYNDKTIAEPTDIIVSNVTYPCGDRTVAANLFRPNGTRDYPGVILAHGAVKDGKDDSALRIIGRSLARAGYVTLIPQLENLHKFRLNHDDIDTLATSFQYLSGQDFVNGKVAMMGFCLSAPLVLLAATEPDVREEVAVVSSWGGYYNIEDWVLAVITGYYSYQGKVESWEARSDLADEVTNWLIEMLPSRDDRVHILRALKWSSPITDETSLTPSGQALYELLINRDLERAGKLWARLDSGMRDTLNSLSPHNKIDQLKTRIAMVHAFSDDAIPSGESFKLADAVREENKIYFKIFHQFGHVDPEQLLDIRKSNFWNIVAEIAQFYLYIYHVLYQL